MTEPLRLSPSKYLSPVENVKRPYVLGRVPNPEGSLKSFTCSYSAFGGKESAFDAARIKRDKLLRALWGNKLNQLTLIGAKPKTAKRTPRIDTVTGKVGVNRYYDHYGKFVGFIASWTNRDLEGKLVVRHKYFHSGSSPEIDHHTSFINASRLRDEMTGCKLLADSEYIELLNPDCMVDKNKSSKD